MIGNGFGSSSCRNESDAFKVNDEGEAFADTYKTFSDRRLKTAIQPLSDEVLTALQDIRPVRYEFKNQQAHPSGTQLGLIAQDVQKEFPSLVSEDSDGYLSLAYPKLTAVLLKGLQEQQRRIESLQDRVRQIKTLRKRVARLEAGSRGGSVLAGVPGSDLLLGLLIGGLLGAGLLWRIREGIRDTFSLRSERRRS